MHAGPLFDDWPFKGLSPHGYDLIMADPPWDFSLYSEKGGNKSAQKHYRCLPIEEIRAFPVMDLAKPNCMLLMWATNPMLPEQIETMRRWGFAYKSMAVWRKKTIKGKVAFGTGYILRSAHEPILVGVRGNPLTAKNVRSIFDGQVREHSRKPEEGYRWAESLMPAVRARLELFSRTDRKGWSSWGDQVGQWKEETTVDA